MEKNIPSLPKKPIAERRPQIGTNEERELYRTWKRMQQKRLYPNCTEAQLGKIKMPAWKRYSNMLEQCIQMWAQAHGHSAVKIDVGGTFRKGKYTKTKATKGVEDIQLIVNGKFIAIEVKAGKDRMGKAQVKRQAECNAQGVPYLVVHTLHGFLESIKVFV